MKSVSNVNSLFCVLAFSVVSAFSAGEKDSTVQALAKELKGQQKWLKIDVVKIQYAIGGKDATYVYPDGKAHYKAKVGEGMNAFRDTQSTSAEDFAEEARSKIKEGSVRIVNRGIRVTIHEVKLGGDEIQVGITDEGGAKAAIKFVFENKNYTGDQFKTALANAFANNESELKGASETMKIEMGMSIEDVIKAKGNPKSRVDLGPKVILTYEDMKIIFQEGKLVDVQ